MRKINPVFPPGASWSAVTVPGEHRHGLSGPGVAAPQPLVTIATPCLNMKQYIGETLESVISQDYGHIEYLLMDGGSTDGTLEIIEDYARKYPEVVRLISRADDGTSDALERALGEAKGEIFAYLNADDTYFPGAVGTAVRGLQEHPGVAGVYGNAYWVGSQHDPIDVYPTEPYDAERLQECCYICQPACFLRTDVLREMGGFNTKLQVAYDYELWLRISARYEMLRIDLPLANSRMHRENKTLGRRTEGFREAMAAIREHRGYVPFRWAHSYVSYQLDGRDQFFEPLRPSFTKYAAALVVGTAINWRNPLRFWREWYGVMSVAAFVRRWNETWIAQRLGLRLRQGAL